MWDLLMKLQVCLLWALGLALVSLVVIICVAASIKAKSPLSRDKGDDDEL